MKNHERINLTYDIRYKYILNNKIIIYIDIRFDQILKDKHFNCDYQNRFDLR